ncbi:MAG: F-type +-transporting ATPase subunit a [Candidatus Kaiserbacteria bacterium]|nr:F-type +-transporting ATPase subunit a [Candidatus Kaiserbacteria bacterium]
MLQSATMASSAIEVSLSSGVVGHLFGIPITNTLITSWVSIAVLIIGAILLRNRLSYIPGRFQILIEAIVTYIQDFIQETLESEVWSRRAFPLLATIFLFIATSNLIEFTPGIGSIVVNTGGKMVPLLRSVNTDLNVTLALAIIVVIAIEIFGIVGLGFIKYGSKFFNFSSPLNFVVGLIEFISEMSRFISFSFRLFGNIFAGEVLLAVIGYFAPYIVPVPVMAFETFVGIVQAAVFALLTLFFIKLAITDMHEVSH